MGVVARGEDVTLGDVITVEQRPGPHELLDRV
jgi:hypothetical protein